MGLRKLRFKKQLDPPQVKSLKKFHLKKLRNNKVMVCNVISAQSIEKWLSSWLIGILHVLHGIGLSSITAHISAIYQPFELKFFVMNFYL